MAKQRSNEAGDWYKISYTCPECGERWEEEWDCACDSECPSCGLKNIEAEDFEKIK